MGNTICCLDNDRKIKKKDKDNPNYKYFNQKSDAFLTKRKIDIKTSKNTNAILSSMYFSATCVSIIIISTGGPATLAISAICGGILTVVYIYNTRSDMGEIILLDKIKNERSSNNILVLENTYIQKKE